MAQNIKQNDGLIMKLIISVLLCIVIAANVYAAPSITSSNNSKSANIFPHVGIGESVNFNVTASETITTWVWIMDGTNQNNNAASFSKSWNYPGQHAISVNGSNGNGSTQTVSWYILIIRPKSTSLDRPESLNTSWMKSIISAFGNDWDFSQFFVAISLPFTTTIDDLFYIFVFLLPVVVIWIRQEKAIIPAVLGVIFGYLLLGFLPESWILPAMLFISITILGIVYSLFKER